MSRQPAETNKQKFDFQSQQIAALSFQANLKPLRLRESLSLISALFIATSPTLFGCLAPQQRLKMGTLGSV